MKAAPSSALPFCLAPWVHAYRGTDGFRSLCCLTTSIQADQPDFFEWWNGEDMRAARRTLLSGGIPAACSPCVHSNRTHGNGYNLQFEERYRELGTSLRRQTADDGTTTLLPRSIDHRSMHCNLKCRTCDARNSSSIDAEQRAAGKPAPPRAAAAHRDRRVEPKLLDEINHVYWAGGEPLMSPLHEATMDELIERGRAPFVSVFYTSNLMHYNERVQQMLQRYAEVFGSVTIGASIDGTGETGAYIRTGWDEARFFEHLRSLTLHAPRIAIVLDVTLTNLGVLGLPRLLERCSAERLKMQFKLMECNGENDFLDISLLRADAIDAVLQACWRVDLPDYYRRRLAEITDLLMKRFDAAVFSAKHRWLMQQSEQLRGSPGYFLSIAGEHLNLAAEAEPDR